MIKLLHAQYLYTTAPFWKHLFLLTCQFVMTWNAWAFRTLIRNRMIPRKMPGKFKIHKSLQSEVTPPKNKHVPWKIVIGRLLSFWNGPFLGDMLVFRDVSIPYNVTSPKQTGRKMIPHSYCESWTDELSWVGWRVHSTKQHDLLQNTGDYKVSRPILTPLCNDTNVEVAYHFCKVDSIQIGMFIHFVDVASSLFSGFAATSIESLCWTAWFLGFLVGCYRGGGVGAMLVLTHAHTHTHTHTRTHWTNSSESGFCFTSRCDE